MGKMREMGAEELIKRLNDYCEDPEAKFAFFIGAGCSVSSGIPTSSKLVKDQWLPKLYRYENRNIEFKQWVEEVYPEFDPQNPALIYGKVIDRLFPLPQQRQDEIERICKGVLPGFGYGVLSELVARGKNKFNVIITTNFDNLIADAMYLFTNNHPLVITHASLVSFIRPTTSKPLIVKLHHDAQLGPLNIDDEINEIEQSLQVKFGSLIFDRGLIFIGYGGNDPGIIQMLEKIPEDALPYGIYWVNGEEPQGGIRKWLELREAFWINQFDFDEFMLIVKYEFDIEDPDRKHIDKVFDNYFETLKKLGSAIKTRDKTTNETKLLDEALKNAIEGIKDPYGYYLKASAIEKENQNLANRIYEKGIEKYPDSTALNVYYAIFLSEIRKDYDRAEVMYKHALELDPNLSSTTRLYAIFLKNIRKEYDQAEELYKRALELDPENAANFGSYAIFLKNIRGDYNRAENMYKHALELDSEDATNIGNYAILLNDIRKDYDRAEELYKRALELDQEHAYNIENYAVFLSEIRKDYGGAEELYKHALKLNPEDANIYGNYAGFHFIRKNKKSGLRMLTKAIDLLDINEFPDLAVEVWFYAYVHWLEDKRKEALVELKKHLLNGIRSDFFMVSENAVIAKEEKYPEAEWILKLAEVIRGREDISILDDWQAWKDS